jgi:hypothetical protein
LLGFQKLSRLEQGVLGRQHLSTLLHQTLVQILFLIRLLLLAEDEAGLMAMLLLWAALVAEASLP